MADELYKKNKRLGAMNGKKAEEARHLKEMERKKLLEGISDKDRVKQMDLEEIFMIITRAGAAGFTPMIVNSVESMMERKLQEFEERIDDKIRQVASGISKGLLESAYPDDEIVEFELEPFLKEDRVVKAIPNDKDVDDASLHGMMSVDDLIEEKEEEEEVAIKPKRRRDNWTEEEDQVVIEMVTEYVRAKKTKLSAFRDISDLLDNRTPDAVGYRWNTVLSKRVSILA